MTIESEVPPKIFYGKFDAEGKPQGFWVDDIYPPQGDGTRNTAIATAAIEITEATWQTLLSDQNARYVGGQVVRHDPPPPPPPEPSILYDHENRLRAIEGEPPLSLGDFIAKAGG